MMNSPPSLPLTPSTVQNKRVKSLEQLEGTPVGDQNRELKVQLCIELRQKEVAAKKSSKTKTKSSQLVLEVAVMYIKNLRRRQDGNISKKKTTKPATFVKIIFDTAIHSTELKMDKQNEDKVDFIEVFEFPLQTMEDLKGKQLELQLCDKKMTRNAEVFGRVQIPVDNTKIGQPVCDWFYLESSTSKVAS